MRLMEEVAPEEQSGLRPRDGSCAAASMALRRRRERSQEAWALLVDLVRAFDTVPHRALLAALRRCGVPDRCLSVIIRLRVHDQARARR